MFSRSVYFYKLLYMFQAVPPPIIRSTKLYIQRQVLSNKYCCYRGWDGTIFHLIHNTAAIVDKIELHSILSTIAAGNSIGLTIRDAVCTVLCSWWWVEELPETCRTIYRNKQIKKMLRLVGCTLETKNNVWVQVLWVVPKTVAVFRYRWCNNHIKNGILGYRWCDNYSKKIFGYRWCENCTNKSVIPFTPPAATMSAAVTIRILLTKFCILLLSFNVQKYSINIYEDWFCDYHHHKQLVWHVNVSKYKWHVTEDSQTWELCNTALFTDRQLCFRYIFGVLNSYKCMLRLKLLHISPL
jgi:hypothetical protein